MNDSLDSLRARIEELEIRIAHQEVTLDELTRQQLEQARLLRAQSEQMQRLEVKSLLWPE